MKWQDNAIILNVTKYSESSAIISMLTENLGLYKGLVRSVKSRNNRGTYLPSNYVLANWNARLPEHLGNFQCEIVKSNACLVMNSFAKLSAINCICSTIESTLAEREAVCDLYLNLQNLIDKITNCDDWEIDYILFELNLISELGFRLNLNTCVVTGQSDDLHYISPKSGSTVCKEKGEPYKNKLFKMPEFFKNNYENYHDHSEKKIDIIEGFKITSYFLDKYFFKPNNIKTPKARINMSEALI